MNANLHLGCRTKRTRIYHPTLSKRGSVSHTEAITVKDKSWAGSGQHYKDDQLVLFLSLVLLKGSRCANYFKAPTH